MTIETHATVLLEYLVRVGPAPLRLETPAPSLNPDDLLPPLSLTNQLTASRGFVTLKNGQIWPKLPPSEKEKELSQKPSGQTPSSSSEPKTSIEPPPGPPSDPAALATPEAILRFFAPAPGSTNFIEGPIPINPPASSGPQPSSRATYSNPPPPSKR